MRNLTLLLSSVVAIATFALLDTSTAVAQCGTCPTQTVAYSPVVYNTYATTYDGWYPGKLIGRLGQRLFGTAPAPAVVPAYAAAYPTTYAAAYPTYSVSYAPATYAASYAPTYAASYAPTYATSYAPAACATCSASPCNCNPCATQTTYRPVIMQSAGQCDTCSGVVTTSYDAPVSTGCATCTANYADQAVHVVPATPAPAVQPHQATPPQTFRETDRPVEPTPATGSSNAASWEPPMLIDPNDKQAKRPNTTVWTAVYKQPASQPVAVQHSVSSQVSAPAKVQPTVRWAAGR